MLLEETNNISPTWSILACTTSVIYIVQMFKSMTKQMFHLENQIKQVAISMGNRSTMHWILKLRFYKNCQCLISYRLLTTLTRIPHYIIIDKTYYIGVQRADRKTQAALLSVTFSSSSKMNQWQTLWLPFQKLLLELLIRHSIFKHR